MGGRAVEGTGLENRQACERLVGSNPTPSAIIRLFTVIYGENLKIPMSVPMFWD
jgi:hypothetical protein